MKHRKMKQSTKSSRAKLSKIAALFMGIAIAAVIGEWIGKDLDRTPLLVLSILYTPWLVTLLVILAIIWCGWGWSVQRFLGRLGVLVILVSALLLGFWLGHHVATRAFNECIKRGEEVREALAYYNETHGRYPTTLTELELQNLPGDCLLRGNILSYDSDGDSYRLYFSDWLVRHDASDDSPFIATK